MESQGIKNFMWVKSVAWAIKMVYGEITFQNCLEFLGSGVVEDKPFEASTLRTAAIINHFAHNNDKVYQ